MVPQKKIELENVDVGYMTDTVIKDLSVTVYDREIVGIFGSNGAGKTTLLCAVNGLAALPKGRVLVNGIELTSSTANMIRRLVGYVPQHFEVDPRLPILSRDVILMGRYGKMGLFNYGSERERRLLDDVSCMMEVEHLLNKPFGLLSGGEKKKMLIAGALMKEPEVMLLDEVFAWLDWAMVKKFIGQMREIHHKELLTTLIVSHDIDIIKNICERVIWMERGKIIFDGSTGTFIERFNLQNGIA